MTMFELSRREALAGPLNINTSQSGRVWLPIRFDDDRPVIVWRDEWTLEEYA